MRREKDSTVCANAGLSNWTGITNFKARAQQAVRRNQRNKEDECALVDDILEDNIAEMLQTEEDKVCPQQKL